MLIMIISECITPEDLSYLPETVNICHRSSYCTNRNIEHKLSEQQLKKQKTKKQMNKNICLTSASCFLVIKSSKSFISLPAFIFEY